MHAEHANNSGLNELSGRLTRGSDAMHQLSESDGSATLPASYSNYSKPRLEIKRVAHGL
jgi:hypothetical protein